MVCYKEVRGEKCCFGTVISFFEVLNRDGSFALIQRWSGIEADLDVHQVFFRTMTTGSFDIVPVTSIRCLVGVLIEDDTGHAGRTTKGIINAIEQVRRYGIR